MDKWLDKIADATGFTSQSCYSSRPKSYAQMKTSDRFWMFVWSLVCGTFLLFAAAFVLFVVIGFCMMAPIIPVAIITVGSIAGALVFFTRKH